MKKALSIFCIALSLVSFAATQTSKEYVDRRDNEILSHAKEYTDDSVSGLAHDDDIPTKVSQLQNDTGYVTGSATNGLIERANSYADEKSRQILLEAKQYTDNATNGQSKVISVNGRTGNVVLSSVDVHARPDNWMPSAEDVGAQPKLVSGANIKTVNGNSLLGSGNIVIQGGSGGGGIDTNAVRDIVSSASVTNAGAVVEARAYTDAHTPGNYATVSNRAMTAVQPAEISDMATKSDLAGKIDVEYSPYESKTNRFEWTGAGFKVTAGRWGYLNYNAEEGLHIQFEDTFLNLSPRDVEQITWHYSRGNKGGYLSLPSKDGVLATTSDIPTDSTISEWGYLKSESDPTVPSWAKATSKPIYSWSDITNKPTTLSGYGITDAKIQNGTITLGSNSITPVMLSDISATNPTFSNAVLAVGLNIDTNSVAQINAILNDLGGVPIEGTAITVGGLLLALAAAVALLRKKTALLDNDGKPTDTFATECLRKPDAITAVQGIVNDMFDNGDTTAYPRTTGEG